MPIFELTPNNPNLPDWDASTYRGSCRVCARDSFAARRYARTQFLDAANEGQYRGQRKIFCPWADQSLVRCRRVSDDDAGLADGAVFTPADAAWGDEPGTPTDAVASDGAGHLRAAAPLDAASANLESAFAQGFRHNRDNLSRQTEALLTLLQAVLAKAPAPGAVRQPAPAAGEAELVSALRAARDQLYRLSMHLPGDDDRDSGADSPHGARRARS